MLWPAPAALAAGCEGEGLEEMKASWRYQALISSWPSPSLSHAVRATLACVSGVLAW